MVIFSTKSKTVLEQHNSFTEDNPNISFWMLRLTEIYHDIAKLNLMIGNDIIKKK